MNFEEFKEQFVEDVKQKLEDNGIECRVDTHEVSKLNESYEAITVTPEGSNVGVNVNMNRFFEAMENGFDYDEVVDKAVGVVEQGINNGPTVDVASITDYDQMKDKLGDCVVVLASAADGKVNLMATATDSAIKKGAHAGNLIKAIAGLVGGGGGGRPNMAQAGGKNPAGIADAVAKAYEVCAEQIH